MTDSPSKRRKTSPTTSFPIDAPPGTPSRIPVLRQQQDASKSSLKRPSFASPTRASLARHNPQLLSRPTSSGTGVDKPVRKNLEDLFAKALGEARSSIEGDGAQQETDEQEGTGGMESTESTEDLRPTKSIGGVLSAKPRRMSRSPVKSAKAAERVLNAPDLDGIVNPFGKKGLRRSPISSQAESARQDLQVETVQEDIDPFKKRTGLRRSPISSQADSTPQKPEPIKRSGLRRSLEPSKVDSPTPDPEPIRRAGLRRSPVVPQADAIALNPGPVKRSGLRRSPVIAEADVAPRDPTPEAIPFKKTGLRRSPIPEPSTVLNEVPEQFRTTPPGPPPSRALQPAPTIVEKAVEDVSPEAISTPVKAPETLETPKPVGVSKQVEPPKQVEQPMPMEVEETVSIEKVMSKSAATKEDNTSRAQASQKKTIERSRRPGFTEEIILDKHSIRPVEPEPELPPTPTQLGLADPVVTTSPTGIHNTPSKRARRNKSLAGKLKSSPLKPRDERPKEADLNSGKGVTPIPSLVPDSQVTKPEKPKKRKSARFLIPEDPHAEKKKERDALLKELQELQADIALGNQETERLRLLQESKKKVNAPPVAKDSEELVAMLLRSTAQEPATIPDPKPTSIFKSIGAFLPFRSRRKQTVAASILPILEKPLPSLLPVEMEDPLPYLQAFTPLTYTSTISLLPPTPSSPDAETETEIPQLQQHLISASHPLGLFFSRLSLTVNITNYSIFSLEIMKLDPAAESELGEFLREKAEKRELSVLCWAMGRWAEVASKRAGFWCAVNAEFGTGEAISKSISKFKAQPKKRKRAGTVDVNETEEIEEVDKVEQQGNWTRKQLLPHLPRTNFEITNEENGVLLRIEWKMKFDWTGEVESEISATAKVPGSWQQKDDRNSLAKIPETFRRLVKEKGPLSAVRTVVGLLMSD